MAAASPLAPRPGRTHQHPPLSHWGSGSRTVPKAPGSPSPSAACLLELSTRVRAQVARLSRPPTPRPALRREEGKATLGSAGVRAPARPRWASAAVRGVPESSRLPRHPPPGCGSAAWAPARCQPAGKPKGHLPAAPRRRLRPSGRRASRLRALSFHSLGQRGFSSCFVLGVPRPALRWGRCRDSRQERGEPLSASELSRPGGGGAQAGGMLF